jgi:hypothetical protein
MSTAFRQTHNNRHQPIGNLSDIGTTEAAEVLSDRIARIARAHSADAVVFVSDALDVRVIVETSSACVQLERKSPKEVVGRWRRAEPAALKAALDAHLARRGLLIA